MPSKTRTGGAYPKAPIRFVALKDFPCGELMSEYAKGMNYTIKPGYECLHDLVFGSGDEPGWAKEGKVLVLGVATNAGTASVVGVGEVSEGEG